MDLLPDADQAQIAAEVRDLLEHHSPPGRLREQADGKPVADPKLWRQATDQGWFALALAEDDNGAGLGLAEQTLLFRELGRYLVPGPFLGTVLAAHVAAASGEDELLAAIVDGRAPVALCEPSSGDELRTFDADDAEMFLVVDATAATLLPRPGVSEQRRRPSLDLASHWAELAISGDAVCRVDGDETWLRGQVLVAAMLSGIAEATRDASASYAKLRKQFDVAIGSFQAVKHRCAEQAVRAEAAAQATTLAALSFDTSRDDARLQIASARLVAGDFAVTNAADNVQNHGGIGYTAEHDAHLFVKRAHVLALTLGEPAELQAAVLDAPPIRPSE